MRHREGNSASIYSPAATRSLLNSVAQAGCETHCWICSSGALNFKQVQAFPQTYVLSNWWLLGQDACTVPFFPCVVLLSFTPECAV